MCEDAHGDDLVAIDWWREDGGACYCQNDCECMEDVGDDEGYLITRDGTALPEECDDGEVYSNPFAGIDVGYYSAPALGDIDGDGTLRPRPSID